MEKAPDPSPENAFGTAALPKRRRHKSTWQKIPKAVQIAAGLCLVFLAVLLFLNRNRTPAEPELKTVRAKVSPGEAFDKVISNTPKQIDLVLSKAALNRATSRIEGVLTNTSDRRYTDVDIAFFVSLGDLTEGSTTIVRVPVLEPHGNAPFASDPIHPQSKQWTVKSIGGIPH